MEPWQRVIARGRRQFGALRLDQGPLDGVPERTLRDVASRQGWEKPFPNKPVVYLPGSAPGTLRTASAVLLAVGDRAWITGWTAAHLLGFADPRPSSTHLLLPHGRRRPDLAGVETVRSRLILPAHLRPWRGLQLTAPDRAVCDLSPRTSLPALRSLLIDGRQRRCLDLERVLRTACELRNVPGMPRLRRVLLELGVEVSDSTLEYLLRRLFDVPALRPEPAPVPVAVGGRTLHIDIGWSRYRVGIEAEGFGAHSNRRHLDRDARRRNLLYRSGWSIEVVTWGRYDRDPDDIVAAVTERLRERGWPA